MAILVFAGVLSVPSAVFAEASWYGSLRVGVESGGDSDARLMDVASRWGIRGSNEVGEGLTAVYQFETKIDTSSAGLPGGRLSYVGLSGGFGTLTLGQIWSASYNHSGAIRDIFNWHSMHDTAGNRVGNNLSYSVGTGAISMQIDAMMDSGKNTGGAIDGLDFGMTFGLGEIGKIGLGYTKLEDSTMDGMAVSATQAGSTPGTTRTLVSLNSEKGIQDLDKVVWRKADGDKAVVKGKVSDVMYMVDPDDTGANPAVNVRAIKVIHIDGTAPAQNIVVKKVGDNYYVDRCDEAADRATGAACEDTATSYVWVSTSYGEPDKDGKPTPTYTVQIPSAGSAGPLVVNATVTPTETTYGSKQTHISAQFGLGAVTLGLGHTVVDSNDPMKSNKKKTNYIGASGSIGDTGLSWGAWYRSIKGHDRMTTKPWGLSLTKSLGDGARTFIEHANYDDNKGGLTLVGLRADF